MNLRKVFGFAIATFAVAAAVYFVTPAIDSLAVETSGTETSGSEGTSTGGTSTGGTSTGGTSTEGTSTEGTSTEGTSTADVELTTSTTVNATSSETQQEINHNRRAAAAAAAGTSSYTATESTYVAPNGVTVRQFTSQGTTQGLVAGAPGIIPSGTKVVTDTVDASSPIYNVATTIMSMMRPDASVVGVIAANAQTTDGTWLSTLDGEIAMSVPVPTDLVIPDGQELHVYKFLPDGSIEQCETIIDNGRIVWGTDAFATFAFVVE